MHFFRQSCYFIALNKRVLVIFSSMRPLVAISFFPVAEKSCLLNSNAVQTQALFGDGASSDTYCHRFGLLPVRQQVRGAVLHRADPPARSSSGGWPPAAGWRCLCAS